MIQINKKDGIKGVISIISVICVFLLSFLFFFKPVMAEEELILGVHPYLRHFDLIERFTPIADYFSSFLGQSVRIEIAENYQDHIKALGENKFDIAYLGPVPYVRVVDAYGAIPILGKFEIKGRNTFRGVIIVREDSDIKKLTELDGKRFAFGDTNSDFLILYWQAFTLENTFEPA
jgi:phosphonate transport system substrate-binding protein